MNWDNEIKRICDFIQTYVKESKCNGIVLGMSGGIDSAVVAALCNKAGFKSFNPNDNPQEYYNIKTNKNMLQLYYLPEEHKDNDIHWDHIEKFCEKFNLSCIDIPMKDAEYGIALTTLCGSTEKLVRGNIKARVRMTLLYAFANRHNYLVIGTTNRSEFLIGYFTKWGDGGCDLEPILHLYKTEIFELAKHLGIPEEIINKKPTAGLWEGQTDEGELGITYKKLDTCLQLFDISPDFDDKDMKKKNIKPDEIEKVRKLMINSYHKRKCIPCLERYE